MNEYKSEEEFKDEIQRCLENNNYEVWREEIPDGCKNWDKPYKADILFTRGDLNLIGIEAKNTNTIGSGGAICDAVNQIERQYKNRTYLGGNMVNRWCIALPTEKCEGKTLIFLRNFLKKMYNISLLEYEKPREYYTSKIVIDRLKKDSIHIGGDNTYPEKVKRGKNEKE